jgi:DNA ligase-associated metallophosphoesterase
MQQTGLQIIQCQGQTFHLHPFRALYWEEASTLLLADLHLGKAAHFRRAGIPVPRGVSDENWDRLLSLLVDFTPKKVLFLGDLFHSDYNPEWESLGQLKAQFEEISFSLVLGNHDRLDRRHYEAARLQIYEEPLAWGPFLFSHHPLEAIPAEKYNLAGHIHPCVRLRGAGRQWLRLPCFYFGERKGILPAFGAFTGLGDIEVQNGDRVFVIAEDRVVAAG